MYNCEPRAWRVGRTAVRMKRRYGQPPRGTYIQPQIPWHSGIKHLLNTLKPLVPTQTPPPGENYQKYHYARFWPSQQPNGRGRPRGVSIVIGIKIHRDLGLSSSDLVSPCLELSPGTRGVCIRSKLACAPSKDHLRKIIFFFFSVALSFFGMDFFGMT